MLKRIKKLFERPNQYACREGCTWRAFHNERVHNFEDRLEDLKEGETLGANFKFQDPAEKLYKELVVKKILTYWGYGGGPFQMPINPQLSKTRRKELESYNIRKRTKYLRAVEHAERLATMAWDAHTEVIKLGEK